MADFDDTNRGALFENDRKEKDTQPDYRGSINVEGKDYWLSMWDKVAKSGQAYYSLSVQPKEESGKGKDSDAWQKARQKFSKDVEERGDDSAKDEVILDDEMADKISLDDIPF